MRQRIQAVLHALPSQTVIDFGSGLGAAALGWQTGQHQPLSEHWISIELSNEAQKLSLFPYQQNLNSWDEILKKGTQPKNLLGLFSYSLTEQVVSPAVLGQFDSLIILEPATRSDGRKLLQLRAELQKMGFQIWAPCYHQQTCPLLTSAHQDWCHDRFHWSKPNWFSAMETFLPMKNQTLSVSYLVASKSPRPPSLETARLTGDRLVEKGKTRQMICRGPEREFLSKLNRHGQFPEFDRGDALNLPPHLVSKNGEIRILDEL